MNIANYASKITGAVNKLGERYDELEAKLTKLKAQVKPLNAVFEDYDQELLKLERAYGNPQWLWDDMISDLTDEAMVLEDKLGEVEEEIRDIEYELEDIEVALDEAVHMLRHYN